MEIHLKGNKRIFLIAFFGMLMVCSSYLIYFFNPLKLFINKAILLREGSISFKIWENPPYDIYLKIYIFNVTNADAFIAGREKLKFEEIGPFTYQEMLYNTNPVFNDNNTLTFNPKRKVKFIPELSVGDPNTTYINVPNVPLLGIASMLHQSSMFLNLAVLSITRALNAQVMLNMTVYDYFWGYEDKLVHMASSILPNWISFQKLGILDRMYDEGNNTVTINLDPTRKTGSTLIPDEERGRLYSILTWNGSPGLSHWGYKLPVNNKTVESNSKCNMLEGAYDGTLFPPQLTEDMSFRVYRKFFCRTMPIVFDRKGITEDGFNAFHYKVKENFLYPEGENPDNECYCKDKNHCLPVGLGDATPCYYGFPAAVSLPHLLRTDPSVFDKIEGLSPSEEKHGTNVLINPDVGLVLKGYSRMQVNLYMWKTKYNYKTAPFNNMVLPLFWSELSVASVPPEVSLLMTLMFKVGPIAQIVVIVLLAIIGAGMIATAGILAFVVVGGVVPSPSLQSQTINVGYTAIRMIPVIRRESWLSDIRRSLK